MEEEMDDATKGCSWVLEERRRGPENARQKMKIGNLCDQLKKKKDEKGLDERERR